MLEARQWGRGRERWVWRSQSCSKKVRFLPETGKWGEKLLFQNSQELTHFHRGPREEQLMGGQVQSEGLLWGWAEKKEYSGHFESLIWKEAIWCLVPRKLFIFSRDLGFVRVEGPMVAPWADEGLHLTPEAWLVPASAPLHRAVPTVSWCADSCLFRSPSGLPLRAVPLWEKHGRFLILATYIWEKQSKC